VKHSASRANRLATRAFVEYRGQLANQCSRIKSRAWRPCDLRVGNAVAAMKSWFGKISIPERDYFHGRVLEESRGGFPPDADGTEQEPVDETV